MPRDLAASPTVTGLPAWTAVALRIAAAWAVLFVVTFPEWREMAHQWWNIDTYNHVLLVPPILAWLVWLRRDELAQLAPRSWSPGLAWLGAGLLVCLAGRAADINLVAQAGALMAFQGAVLGLVGLRAALVMALPLAYSAFLVPFGDELIPALQHLTARITIALTQLSGIPLLADGLTIDTPGGKFVVAEECSGVKFLVAMIALAVLAGWTGFSRWRPRILLVTGAALVSILANGLRAWGTIYVAQWVGAERAGSFDHIVYGWVFFAIVIVMVLGVAWRYFDREPGEAGFSAAQVEVEPIVRLDRFTMSNAAAMAGIAFLAMAFAALGALV